MALTKIPSSLLDTSGGFDLQGNITLGDNEQILFGAGSDLEIYHDGSNSFIKDVGTGDLIIQGSNAIRLRSSTGENMAIFNADGAATLQYDNLTKLQTTSTGATVTGTLTVTGDLDITGDINSYNVTDLDVTDQTITLGAGQTEANSGGSGIIIDGSSASILWNETDSVFDFNKDISLDNGLFFSEQDFYLYRSGADVATLRVGDSGSHKYFSFTDTGTVARFSSASGAVSLGSGANDHILINSSGNVGIGASSPATALEVIGTDPNNNVSRVVNIKDDRSYAADVGGGISFFGKYNSGGSYSTFAQIIGAKTNGTDGEYSGYLSFKTRSASALPTERMRIDSSGDIIVNNGILKGMSHLEIKNDYGTDGTATSPRLFSPASGTLAFSANGGERMRITSAGRISLSDSEGIKLSAKTSGMYALDGALSYYGTNNGVYLNGAGSNGWLRLNASGLSNNRTAIDLYGQNQGDSIKFRAGDDDAMWIVDGGKVGIGTSSPDNPLDIEHVGGDGDAGIRIISTASDSFNWITEGTNANLTAGEYLAHIFGKEQASKNSAHIAFKYASDHGNDNTLQLGFYGVNDILNVTAGGNVGIGQTNPLNTLHIYGTGQTTANLANSGNQGGMLRITDANTGAGAGGAILFANYHADDEPSMGFAAIKGLLNNGSTYTQGSLAFSTRNSINGTSMTERMRLKYNGNFGIGDTDPDAKLTVVASSVSGGVVKIKDTDATTSLGNTILGLYFTNDNDCTNATFLGMYDSGSRIGSITVTNATSVAFNTTSDYRLKENVTYDFNALDRISQLKPARFNWISDETNTLVDGFLAHEVQDIVPEAIHGEKDAVMEEEYEITPAVLDDDGFVVTEAEMGTREVPDYQGIDQSKLVPLLTKAIQELKTELDAAKARITELEG